jgi:AcrR family transcriptional regulator
VPDDVKRDDPERADPEPDDPRAPAGLRRPGQARTRLARRAVVAGARTLFLERGYTGTTMEAIAGLSDVPVATVYRLFASKLGILKALLDTSIAGDDQPVAVNERPTIAQLYAERDQRTALAGFAGVTRAINERMNDAYLILVAAAAAEPTAAELLEALRNQRDLGQGRIAHELARAGSLRAGLDERGAADIVHALMSPEVYRLLVLDRGWAGERYERWLAATLVDQLTGPAVTASG